MKIRTDKGRSVSHSAWNAKSVVSGLSLLLVCAAIGTSFLATQSVSAEEREPIAAVSVASVVAEPLIAAPVSQVEDEAKKPLVATPVPATDRELPEPLSATSLIPEVTEPDAYVNEYLGFTRTDLVAYLVKNADAYLGTPYKEETVAPILGPDGHMQCEGFIWDVMRAVSTQNETDVPCGNIRTEPANGGGWVNWSYYHDVDPITFNTKEEMLASGILEKGDVIWSFDASGPYGLSNANHVGFFWGDDPHDDKFWESAEVTGAEYFAGSADGNRIAGIESMTAHPSVWWVFKLSPDKEFDADLWAGLPVASADVLRAESDEEESAEESEKESEEQADPDAGSGSNEAYDTERGEYIEEESAAVADETASDMVEGYGWEAMQEEKATVYKDAISSSYESHGTDTLIFYNGQEEETGYYSNFATEEETGYYGY